MASLFSTTRNLFTRSRISTTIGINPIFNPISLFSRTFASKKHKAILKHAKGFRGRGKNCFKTAVRRVEKGWAFAYRDRRVKKRLWRRLWIQRLTAASRQYGVRYSRLIAQLNYCNIQLNRKVLSELAATEPFSFKACMDVLHYQNEQYHAGKLERNAEESPEDMAA